MSGATRAKRKRQRISIYLSDRGDERLTANIVMDPPVVTGREPAGASYRVLLEVIALLGTMTNRARPVRITAPDAVMAVAESPERAEAAAVPEPEKATVWDLVRAERARQVNKGFSSHHDTAHFRGELAQAAVAYVAAAQGVDMEAALLWPFDPEDAPVLGSHSRLRLLVVAIALLHAETERHAPHLRKEVRP